MSGTTNYWDEDENIRWQPDVDYVMKADGLLPSTDAKADGWNDKERSSKRKRTTDGTPDEYQYNEFDKENRFTAHNRRPETPAQDRLHRKRTEDARQHQEQDRERQCTKHGSRARECNERSRWQRNG